MITKYSLNENVPSNLEILVAKVHYFLKNVEFVTIERREQSPKAPKATIFLVSKIENMYKNVNVNECYVDNVARLAIIILFKYKN